MFGVENDIKVLKEVTWEKINSDARFLREVLSLFYVFSMLLGRIVKDDPIVYGLSLSQKGKLWLLVAKVRVNGIPRVAYTLSSTPTACVRAFGVAWLTGKIELREDKYADI